MLDHTPIGKGLYCEDGSYIPWDVFAEALYDMKPTITKELDREILEALEKITLNEEKP